jgi:hypothetical protein
MNRSRFQRIVQSRIATTPSHSSEGGCQGRHRRGHRGAVRRPRPSGHHGTTGAMEYAFETDELASRANSWPILFRTRCRANGRSKCRRPARCRRSRPVTKPVSYPSERALDRPLASSAWSRPRPPHYWAGTPEAAMLAEQTIVRLRKHCPRGLDETREKNRNQFG